MDLDAAKMVYVGESVRRHGIKAELRSIRRLRDPDVVAARKVLREQYNESGIRLMMATIQITHLVFTELHEEIQSLTPQQEHP